MVVHPLRGTVEGAEPIVIADHQRIVLDLGADLLSSRFDQLGVVRIEDVGQRLALNKLPWVLEQDYASGIREVLLAEDVLCKLEVDEPVEIALGAGGSVALTRQQMAHCHREEHVAFWCHEPVASAYLLKVKEACLFPLQPDPTTILVKFGLAASAARGNQQ